MYTRESRPAKITPPDNYSGTAFNRASGQIALPVPCPEPGSTASQDISDLSDIPTTHIPSDQPDIPTLQTPADPSDPPTTQISADPSEPTASQDSTDQPDGADIPVVAQAHTAHPSPRGILPFEPGFEEMLIVGLILLLSQSKGDRDILFILTFLLFYR